MATLISTPQDLHNIRNDLSGSYELANDIDLGSWGNWTPIDGFMGQLDGKGHVIRNLTINETRSYVGLFGQMLGTPTKIHIQNLGFEDVNIVTTMHHAGVLFGYFLALESNLVENCYVKGGYIQANSYAGGLFGRIRNQATVRNCYAELDSIHSVTQFSGGFFNLNESSNVSNCYAVTHSLTSGNPNTIHGFGHDNDGDSTNSCFWDTDVSGVTTSSSGTGKTTTEMKKQSTYPTYDFTTVWGMNGDYPYLQAFGVPVVPPKQVTKEISSYINLIHSNVDIKTYTYQPPQTVTRQVNSHVDTLSSHLEQFVAASRNVEGYLSPIHSNVITDGKSGKIDVRNVSSFIDPILSNLSIEIYRQPLKVTRYISSHLKPIQAHTDVLIYVPSIPIHATVNVLESGSISSYIQNNTNIYRIKNPSYCEVVK